MTKIDTFQYKVVDYFNSNFLRWHVAGHLLVLKCFLDLCLKRRKQKRKMVVMNRNYSRTSTILLRYYITSICAVLIK